MLINITDDIVRLYKAGILDRLLCDKTTGRNILWATDAYAELGARYERNEEIAPELITGASLGVIKTRARKAFEQQTERTRHRAEVFTPLWIVRKMCDHADEAWFGYSDVFFKDGEPTERVRFFENKHTWQDYVDSRRMEITCGEGPFLASRYDAATGELIPIAERVGLLDRKLRVVSENAETEAEWLTWAVRAFQSVYGYEWAGDNLLIARVNLLASFREHFEARFGHLPEARAEKKLANIIAWNILQMDGLSYTVPYSHAPEDQISLFESEYRPPPLCHTFNWRARKNVELKGVGTEMKFDFIIGNPPYQEENDKNGRQPPVYHMFMDSVYSIGKKVELITPARFLFDAGNTPSAWNKKMLADKHLKVLYYAVDASSVFPNTSIVGGVAITYHDTTQVIGPTGFFTPFAELNSAMRKINSIADNYLDSVVSARGNYRLTRTFFDDFEDVPSRLGAGTGNMLVSNIFEKIPEAFSENPIYEKPCIKILGRLGNTRVYRYIERKYIIENDYLDSYNVLLSKADGAAGRIGVPIPARIIGKAVVANCGECGTDTFISIGRFSTQIEGVNLDKYLQTKFARAALGTRKVTQDNSRSVWQSVPIQDFTPASDIDWSKPIPEIDQQLYRKYGLDQSEIDFIESHVKEMA